MSKISLGAKKLLAITVILFITLISAIGFLPGGLMARAAGTYSVGSTAITIDSSNVSSYEGSTITGSYSLVYQDGSRLVISGVEVSLTFNDLTITDEASYTGRSLIALENNATLNLTLTGENYLQAFYGGAGIEVPEGCTLNITAESTGKLTAIGGDDYGGGAGIGAKSNRSSLNSTLTGVTTSCGTINIYGGTIIAQGGTSKLNGTAISGAAAIGGASELAGVVGSGSITIAGGDVTATGGAMASAIGGGYSGQVASVNITGGTVKAYTTDSKGCVGAAIGGGFCNVEDVDTGETPSENRVSGGDISITGGTVYADGNIGYGSGNTPNAYEGGSVSIGDGAILSYTGDILTGTQNVTANDCALNIVIYDPTLTGKGELTATLKIGSYEYMLELDYAEFSARKSVGVSLPSSLTGECAVEIVSGEKNYTGSLNVESGTTAYDIIIGEATVGYKISIKVYDARLTSSDVNYPTFSIYGVDTKDQAGSYGAYCASATYAIVLPNQKDGELEFSFELASRTYTGTAQFVEGSDTVNIVIGEPLVKVTLFAYSEEITGDIENVSVTVTQNGSDVNQDATQGIVSVGTDGKFVKTAERSAQMTVYMPVCSSTDIILNTSSLNNGADIVLSDCNIYDNCTFIAYNTDSEKIQLTEIDLSYGSVEFDASDADNLKITYYTSSGVQTLDRQSYDVTYVIMQSDYATTAVNNHIYVKGNGATGNEQVKIVLQNININHKAASSDNYDDDVKGVIDISEHANVAITLSGTNTINRTKSNSNSAYYYNHTAVAVTNGSTLVFDGDGTLDLPTQSSTTVYCAIGSRRNGNGMGTIIINGGTFNIGDNGSVCIGLTIVADNTASSGLLQINGGSIYITQTSTGHCIGSSSSTIPAPDIEITGGYLNIQSSNSNNYSRPLIGWWHDTKAYSCNITVSGGTLDLYKANVKNINYFSVGSGKLTVTGGTIREASTGNEITALSDVAPVNNAGETVLFTSVNIGVANALVTAQTLENNGIYNYGVNDVYTDSNGYVQIYVNASNYCAHDYGELIAATSPTCDQEGCYAHYYCSNCSTYFDENKNVVARDSVIIPVNAHTYGEWIETVNATCNATGMTEHYLCSECGKYFNSSYQEVSEESLILAIDDTAHVADTSAWYYADGWEHQRKCSVCGEFVGDKESHTVKEDSCKTGVVFVEDEFGDNDYYVLYYSFECTECGVKELFACHEYLNRLTSTVQKISDATCISGVEYEYTESIVVVGERREFVWTFYGLETDSTNHVLSSCTYETNSDGTHNVRCGDCGELALENEACSGGAATCSAKAKCDYCGGEHGDYDADNHTPDRSVWVANGNIYHKKKCLDCETSYGDYQYHNVETGTYVSWEVLKSDYYGYYYQLYYGFNCSDCGYVEMHKDVSLSKLIDGSEGTCTAEATCNSVAQYEYTLTVYAGKNFHDYIYTLEGMEYDYTNHVSDATQSYVSNNDGSTHNLVCDVCEHPKTENVYCCGGTATCSAKAICCDCGGEYGDYDTDVHNPDESAWHVVNENYHARKCLDCGEFCAGEVHDIVEGSYKATYESETNGSGVLYTLYYGFTCETCGELKFDSYKNVHSYALSSNSNATLAQEATCLSGALYDYKSDIYVANGFYTYTWSLSDLKDNADNHASSEYKYVSNDDGTHNVYHACCEVLFAENEACSGGTAYCNAKAVCAYCNTEYGEYDANSHRSDGNWYSTGMLMHEQRCVCGESCGYTLRHDIVDGSYTSWAEETVVGGEAAYKLHYGFTCSKCGVHDNDYNFVLVSELPTNEYYTETMPATCQSYAVYERTVTYPVGSVNHAYTYTLYGAEYDYTNHVSTATQSYVSNNDGSTHNLVCDVCEHPVTENIACSGGTATCVAKAVCEHCNTEYGEVDSNNHTPDESKWYNIGSKYHYRQCSLCQKIITSTNEYHIAVDGTYTSRAELGEYQYWGFYYTLYYGFTCSVCNEALEFSKHFVLVDSFAEDDDFVKIADPTCTVGTTYEYTTSYEVGSGYHDYTWTLYGFDYDYTNHDTNSTQSYVSNNDGSTHNLVCDACEHPVTENITCSGGTAYCNAKAICDVCGGEHGDYDYTNHDPDATQSYVSNNDGSTHNLVCDSCNQPLTENIACSGGTAYCLQKAICEHCGSEYGEFNVNMHLLDDSAWYPSDSQYHQRKCSICGELCGTLVLHSVIAGSYSTEYTLEERGAISIYTLFYSFECSDCGELKYMATSTPAEYLPNDSNAYETEAATCLSVAKYEYRLTITIGDVGDYLFTWDLEGVTKDSTNHALSTYYYVSNLDGTHNAYYTCCDALEVENVACFGGTATCSAKAVCVICNGEYGSLNSSKHTPDESEWYFNGSNANHVRKCLDCGEFCSPSENHDIVDGSYFATYESETNGVGVVYTLYYGFTCSKCGEVKIQYPNQAYASYLSSNSNATLVQEATCLSAAMYDYEITMNLVNGPHTYVWSLSDNAKNANNHVLSTYYYVSQSGDSHNVYHSCCDALEVEYEACSGGLNRTCISQSVCDYCNAEYGGYAMHNYDTTVWGYIESDGHAHVCTQSGCNANDGVLAHVYDNACDTTCNDCSYVREITHDYTKLMTSETEHWYVCSVCGVEDTSLRGAHVGGTASCDSKAVCTVCGSEYGDVAGHSVSSSWSKNSSQHWHACANCSKKFNAAVHNYSNACDTTCNTCSYVREITHDYSKLMISDTEHWYVCSVCGVENASSRGAHDGVATCLNKATCSVCNLTYGELNANNHESEEFTYVTNSNGTHNKYHACCNGSVAENEACYGGSASCENKAVCSACGS